MTTQEMEKKISLLTVQLAELSKKVALLVPYDEEGDYSAAFVSSIKKAKATKTRFVLQDRKFV